MDTIFQFPYLITTLVLSMSAWHVGVISGLVQALGYKIYIYKSLRHEIDPHPVTWAMFAYGTALLTWFSWLSGASWPELTLPLVCTYFSLRIFFLLWKNKRLRMPKNPVERWSFYTDLSLTGAYVIAWFLSFEHTLNLGTHTIALYQLITLEQREIATWIFLLGSNATTFTAFMPLLREAYIDPDGEHSTAWVVWTSAYSFLALATYMDVARVEHLGDLFSSPVLFATTHFDINIATGGMWIQGTIWLPSGTWLFLVYPLCNICLHGLIAWWVRPSRHTGRSKNAKMRLAE